MTQSAARPTFPLKLVSLKLPDVVSWMGRPQQVVEDNALLILPGQVSEIAVTLKNEGSRVLRWTLELSGDFPSEWQQWQQSSPVDIQADTEVQTYLNFYVPPNFFEAQDALLSESHIENTYQGVLSLYCVYGDDQPDNLTPDYFEEHKQLVGYQAFRLCVRPGCSYLDFLPQIYQASDFMGRFLMIFEEAFDPTIQSMDTLWAYLDPLTAPRALLPFLSKWVAWDLDARWTTKQQRLLLRHAVSLYRQRGTKQGLRRYLHIYTGLPLEEPDCPEEEKRISIVEDFKAGFVFGDAHLNQSAMLGGGRPYHFRVTLRPDSADQLDEPLVRSLIEEIKPAFCTYDLLIFNAIP